MSERLAEIKTPLGNKLLLHRVRGHEELGRPFVYEVELLSEDDSIQAADVVGQGMTVKLALEKESQYRYINGLTTRFADAGRKGRYTLYRAELRPFIWLLSHSSDCRIFQNKSIPDIIKQVFRDRGFSDMEDRLTESYKSLKFVVQYRESALNFVTRLMERAGIYYYFKHEDGKHTLVFADSAKAHKTAPGYEEVPYYPPNAGHAREHDHVYEWRLQKQFRAGAFTVDSFDFKRPSAVLKAKSRNPRDHAKSDFEFYDYLGTFFDASDAEKLAKLHLQAEHAHFEQMNAKGTVRGLNAGHLFSLTKAKRADANREYLVVAADTELEISDYESDSGGVTRGSNYACALTTVDSKTDFRLQIETSKPKIVGAQTAIVTGKEGEDIWTDEYGRVKLKFHWDRSGEANEGSSCWVRVAQMWAGSGFGGLYIPRVGQEVVVNFIDGDPDRPLITGGVYNGDSKPPFALPDKASQSGIKTRSTLGGGEEECNEIRFEDKKGEEELFVHAQRDYRQVVEHDAHVEIKRDQLLTISGSQSVKIEGGHDADGVTGAKLKVAGDYKVAASQTIEISGPLSITLKCGPTSSVEIGPEMITVKVGAATLVVTPAGIVMSPSAAVGNRPI